MRVKRYVVNELSEAVPLIRGELGKDAVILESKEIKIGGFLGMFRKRKLEVLAAVEPNATVQDSKQAKKLKDTEVDLVIEQILKASQRSKALEKDKQLSQETTVSHQKTVQQQSEGTPAGIESSPNNGSSFASRLYGAAKGDEDANTAPSEKVAQASEEYVKPIPTERIEQQAMSPKISQTEQFIVNELKSLRDEMSKLSRGNQQAPLESDALLALKGRLIEQEVDQQWINILIEELMGLEQEEKRSFTAEELWQHAKVKIAEWLEPHKQKSFALDSRIIQFVGPTGVGKTTTIAKLAANLSIKEQKKLGLVTADTYRIAAVEQLRTYANILNIPLEVVFSPLELERSLTALEQSELILMDTAGRNYQSDLHVSEVNSLLPAQARSEAVLVLCLTSRTGDMRIIAEKFSKYGVRKVVFTKWDETNCYGAIFNMAMLYGLTPLYITSGQNVPDDIATFDLDHYIEILLGEPHHV